MTDYESYEELVNRVMAQDDKIASLENDVILLMKVADRLADVMRDTIVPSIKRSLDYTGQLADLIAVLADRVPTK